jgi:hypothetical protein
MATDAATPQRGAKTMMTYTVNLLVFNSDFGTLTEANAEVEVSIWGPKAQQFEMLETEIKERFGAHVEVFFTGVTLTGGSGERTTLE